LVVGSALEHLLDERNVLLVCLGEYEDVFNYPTAIWNIIEYSRNASALVVAGVANSERQPAVHEAAERGREGGHRR
jgi:hypothetical protein